MAGRPPGAIASKRYAAIRDYCPAGQCIVGMLDRFLSVFDSTRAFDLLKRLGQHRIEQLALTGGVAVEMHILLAGQAPGRRSLNDFDFIADDFAHIPETLGSEFLFRHVHPAEIPGRTMMQLVDVDAKLRVDIFRATGASMRRAGQIDLPTGRISMIALEDLIARTARLSLDIASGVPTPGKHAADFMRLSDLIGPADVQSVWGDHRKRDHPTAFKDARDLLHELIPRRSDLLIYPDYSQDIGAACPRCVASSVFPLANRRAIFSVLGYC